MYICSEWGFENIPLNIDIHILYLRWVMSKWLVSGKLKYKQQHKTYACKRVNVQS